MATTMASATDPAIARRCPFCGGSGEPCEDLSLAGDVVVFWLCEDCDEMFDGEDEEG